MILQKIFEKYYHNSNDENAIKEFMSILLSEDSVEEDVKILGDYKTTNKESQISVVVVSDCNSDLINKIKFYRDYLSTVFLLTADQKIDLDKYSSCLLDCNTVIVNYSKNTPILFALYKLLDIIKTDFVLFLSNNSQPSAVTFLLLPHILGLRRHGIYIGDKRSFENTSFDPTLNYFSGMIYNVQYLKNKLEGIDKGIKFWPGQRIIEMYSSTEISFYDTQIERSSCIYNCTVFAKIIIELKRLIREGYNTIDINLYICFLFDYIEFFIKYSKTNQLELVLIYTSIAHLIVSCNEYFLDSNIYEKFVNKFFILTSSSVSEKFLHYCNIILNKYFDKKEFDICIIEDNLQNELNKTRLVDELSEKYKIFYFNNFSSEYKILFNEFFIRFLTKISKITVTSANLEKNSIPLDSELIVVPFKFTPNFGSVKGNDELSLKLHQKNKLKDKYNNIYTDLLFDKDYIAKSRCNVRDYYHINEGDIQVFYLQYTPDVLKDKESFQVNIDVLSDLLQERNVHFIAKRDPLYNYSKINYHIDNSCLKNSLNSFFVVDSKYSIIELLCSCDLFICNCFDFILHAVFAKKPIILVNDIEDTIMGGDEIALDLNKVIANEIKYIDYDIVDVIDNALKFDISGYDEFVKKYFPLCNGSCYKSVLSLIEQKM